LRVECKGKERTYRRSGEWSVTSGEKGEKGRSFAKLRMTPIGIEWFLRPPGSRRAFGWALAFRETQEFRQRTAKGRPPGIKARPPARLLV
jgi:hypothetical protein